MRILSGYLFVTLTILSMLDTPPSFAASVDSKFFGNYVGLSFDAVQSGASFEDSEIRIIVDKDGLHRTQVVEGRSFEVTYSSDWLINVRDSETLSRWFPKRTFGGTDYLAIRQSPNSELAQSILQYVPTFSFMGIASRLANFAYRSRFRMHVYEFLGEGMPVPLAVFTKSDTKGKAEQGLKSLYDKMIAEMAAEKSDTAKQSYDWLLKINFEEDSKTLRSQEASFESKKSVIDRAEHNLWTGTPEQIAERVSLFKYAIQDSGDPKLIVYALNKSELGARVGGMAGVVASALEASVNREIHQTQYYNESEIIHSAVEAVTVQLYEAHKQHKVLGSLQQRFGTRDIAQIYSKTNGKISADDAELLAELRSGQGKNVGREYSVQNLEHLTEVLESTKSFLKLPDRTSMTLERALQDYHNPYDCGALLDAPE
jgi:hypothetical protein